MSGTPSESVVLEVEEAVAGEKTGLRASPSLDDQPQKWFLPPHTTRMQIWDTLVVVSAVFGFCLDLFMFSFDSKSIALWVFAYVGDAFIIIDIFLRFFRGYMKDGILITDRKHIRRHYLRTTFVLDFYSVLPLDFIVFINPGLGAPGIMKHLAKYRWVNRIVRCFRLKPFFDTQESKLGSNTSLLRTVKYTTLAGLVIHSAACGWYAIACDGWHNGLPNTCHNDSWALSFNLGANPDITSIGVGESYVIALYWSVATATSTGYGDISAVNSREKWFSIIAMLIGEGIFFGMILGGMASMLTNFDAQRARYTHRFNVIKQSLRDEIVTEELQKQVVGYYEYLWFRKKGVTDDSLINAMPLTFHAEVSLSGNKYILDKAPMFKGMSEGFMRMLSLEIKPSLYLPGQIIAIRNEICHNMYFIQRGEVEVLSAEDDETPIVSLRHGKLFGEVSLVFSMPRTNSIRAAAHCDLMVLDKADLQNVLHHYPEVARKLQRIAEERCDAAGRLEERVRAGEGIIPASKSLRRFSHTSTHSPMHSMTTANMRHDQFGKKSMEAFDIEELVSVHHGSCATRVHRQLGQWWEDFWELITETVVMPGSRFAKLWERGVLVITLLISVLYPYCASFVANRGVKNAPNVDIVGDGDSGNLLLMTLMYIMDFVLLFDIIVRLRTAVSTPNGTHKDFKSIRNHYVKSWGFVLDVVAILPLDFFSLLTSPGSDRDSALFFLSLNRLIKAWRVPDYFKNLEKDLDVNIATIRFFKFFIYISLLSHWSSCLWYLLTCDSGNCQSDMKNLYADFVFNVKGASPKMQSQPQDVSLGTNEPETSPFEEYVTALYWAAATMTSTGYGDISAHTTIGRSLALAAMLIGLLLYGYCLSSIAATLANGDAPRVNFQEKLFAVQEFMKDHNLKLNLQRRVVKYLGLVFRRHRGEVIPGGMRLMHDMPIQLQQEIAFEDAQETLGQVPLFKDCDAAFLRMLALKTHAYLFTPGDMIVYEGDMGREMYFIRRGTCEILSKDMTRVTSTIGPGQYFGEVGLIFGDYRTATVRAASYCELLMLKRSDLDEVLHHFPLIANGLEATVAHREKDRKEKQEALEGQFKEAAEDEEHLKELHNASKRQHDLDVIRDTDDLQADNSVEATSHQPTDASIKVFDKSAEDFQEPVSQLSFVSRLFSKLLMGCAFLPSGTWFKRWEAIRVAVSIIMAFTVTLQASFSHMDVVLWVINYILDLLCYVDMYLKFHTAFYNENNVLVTHPLSTAKHYFKTNFLIDLVACFPTELIGYAVFRTFTPDAIHVYAVLRLNRLLQMYRAPLAFNYLESGVENETGNIRMLKFFFYMGLFFHIMACLWYMNACLPIFSAYPDLQNLDELILTNNHYCKNNSWTSASDLKFYTRPLASQYIVSLYWASATGASVGYGDIHAKNVSEMLLALLSMIFGIVFFGYVIASVAASLANADSQRARYQEKLTAIQSYIKDQNIHRALEQRVVTYYNYLWLRTKGVEPDSLFDGLPLSLKAEVALDLYQDMINKVPIFQNTEVGFQKMLAMCMIPVYYLSKEYIVRKFDFGKEMFFIHRGTVEVVSEDGVTVFDTMNAGRFFGEISLVFSCSRTASIRAQNNCDFFILTKENLDEVLTHYPSIKEQINRVAEERINAVRKRSNAKVGVASNKSSNNNNNQSNNPNESTSTSSNNNENNSEANNDATTAENTTKNAAKSEPEPAKDSKNENQNNDKDKEKKTADRDDKDKKKKSQNGRAPGAGSSSEQDDSRLELGSDSSEVQTRQPACCLRNKNYLEELLKANRFVLSPDSKVVRYLNRLTCFLAFLTFFTITFQIAFQVRSVGILIFSYVCEAIFVLEIYIKCHVSCANMYGELETDFNKVYMIYFKKLSGFLLDLAALLPLDLFALCFTNTEQVPMRFTALTFLRMIHLLRLGRVGQFFDRWEKELNINVLHVRLTKFFGQLLIVIHFFACVWYFLACPFGTCHEGTWADAESYAEIEVAGWLIRYLDSIYWCVATLTSTGYGDFHALSLVEMIAASVVMVIGQLLFGSILGNIASTLANEESGRVAFEQRLSAVKVQMKDMRLNSKLRNRVVSYFDYLWMRNNGIDQHTLFKDAPFCLQTEIGLAVYERNLKKVPLFEDSEASFFRSLSLMLRPVLFMPNDYIIRQGDVGDEMYFIHRGTVELMDENHQSQVDRVLGAGEFFDDINLLYDVPRRTSVRARSHVDLHALSVGDLKAVLEQFPDVEANIRRLGHALYGQYAASVNAQDHFPPKQTVV